MKIFKDKCRVICFFFYIFSVTVLQSFLYEYFGVVEQIIWVYIISYGKINFDIQELWITSMLPEQIMLTSQGFTVLAFVIE